MIRTVILIISDRAYRGDREDKTGPSLSKHLTSLGWMVTEIIVIPDESEVIERSLIEFCDQPGTDLLITSGGTGVSPRDVTPDVTAAVCQKPVPGLAEFMRMEGLKYTRHSLISRGYTGIRNNTLIVNLPGSPTGAIQSIEAIQDVIPHAVELMQDNPSSESGHTSR